MRALLLLALVVIPAVFARGRRPQTNVPKFFEREALLSMPREQLVDLILSHQGNNGTSSVGSSDTVYWWYYPSSDCPYDDVTGSCAGQSVAQCEATCLATAGCGGFNYPHGFLKQTNCLSNKVSDSTVGLYVKMSTPQPPPPPPPAPAVNFPPIWPMPAQFTNGSASVAVNSVGFVFKALNPSQDLENAFDRFAPLFFPHNADPNPASFAIIGVIVNVTDTTVPLQLGVDESYELIIPSAGGSAVINAATVYGAYHGLETLSQLINFNFDTQSYFIASAPWTITDEPRFSHREVLLDSSRHFLPLETLKNMIQSLTYAKINVVHWHLVDSQSFPFDSPSYPKLSQMGAYSNYERYTVADVAEIVEYARQRGVRVMVEIDTPGHAASWCNGYPEVCPSLQCPQPLNPATNATFDLIAGLFNDLTGGARGTGLFPDNVMHLGGDEVDTTCWTDSPQISAWLTANNLTADGGYEYFVARVQKIAHNYGRDVVGWEEIWDHFGTKLDKSTIIHQWLPGSTIAQQATAAGYRVLWSTDGVWYMDGLSTTWQTMYEQEPCTGIPDNLCDTLVLGGGGEMWGETVDTSDVQQTVWPRLGAIAERLWSPRSFTSADAAAARYSAFRCLLNRRGVAAAPAQNANARTSPPGPGGCYTQ